MKGLWSKPNRQPDTGGCVPSTRIAGIFFETLGLPARQMYGRCTLYSLVPVFFGGVWPPPTDLFSLFVVSYLGASWFFRHVGMPLPNGTICTCFQLLLFMVPLGTLTLRRTAGSSMPVCGGNSKKQNSPQVAASLRT